MSRLAEKIQESLDEHAYRMGKPRPHPIIRIFRKVVGSIKDVWYDHPYVWISNVFYIIRNFRLLWKHIKNMRGWDYSYQLELFCDSLDYLAEGLKRGSCHKNSLRNYRRCLFAAKELRAAYVELEHEDKSYRVLMNNNPIRFKKQSDSSTIMTHDYSVHGEQYYDKMFRIISKRQQKAMKERKRAIWLYIHKHIEHWWE